MPDHIPTRTEGNAKRLEIEAIRAAMNDYRAVPKPTSDYITWVTMLLARLDEAERRAAEVAYEIRRNLRLEEPPSPRQLRGWLAMLEEGSWSKEASDA